MLFVGLCGIAIPGAPAGAGNEREEPDVRVTVRDRTRSVSSWSSRWVFPQDDSCADVESDGIPSYTPAIHAPSRRARPWIVFDKPDRPAEVSISAAPRLRDGLLRQPRKYDAHLEPRLEGGESVAWVARPRMQVTKRLFVMVDAEWLDESGCFPEETTEGASWSFSLRR